MRTEDKRGLHNLALVITQKRHRAILRHVNRQDARGRRDRTRRRRLAAMNCAILRQGKNLLSFRVEVGSFCVRAKGVYILFLTHPCWIDDLAGPP